MKDKHLIKYLQRASLRIGLCLLLVCSANVAFAQVVGLSNPLRDGNTVGFTITPPSQLDAGFTANALIQIDGADLSEIKLVRSTSDDRCIPSVIRLPNDPPRFTICTGRSQSVRVTLELNDPDTLGALTVRLIRFSDQYMTPTDQINEDNRTLNFIINPASAPNNPIVNGKIYSYKAF